MCGIFGIYKTGVHQDRQTDITSGQAMGSVIVHRGPDDKGLWQDPDTPLLLGHCRLSIIDLSAEGHQPMAAPSGRYMIAYNGEIYNFPELRKTLEDAGTQFRSRSDTEVLLAAVDHWGLNQTLQKINGMFAFALWDRKDRVLHLVRDRMGKKPLYIGWAGRSLVFASELKALRQHPDFKKTVNRNTLTAFMRYGCVPAPHCIYENVWQLLPGYRLTLAMETVVPGQDMVPLMEPYWHMPRIIEEARQNPIRTDEQTQINQFESLLEQCTRDRMISDVPLGAFLSGGIDSSAIVALMQKQSTRPVKTFAIGFEEQGFDEASHARAIAQHLGTDHHEHYLGAREALDVIPRLPDIYDEPFADASQIPSYLVSRFARQHVSVALTGDGGDEMLGGYLRHSVVPDFWKRVGWLPRPLRQTMAAAIKARPPQKWDTLIPGQPQIGERLYKIAELLPLKGAEEIYTHLVSQWSPPETVVRDGKEPLIPLTDPAWHPRHLGFTGRMMVGDALSYLPNDILTKVDRASMAVSLEARAPLLDRRVFEHCWRLPQNMKIRDGKGKWLLREVLARHVPRELFERPKQGFTIPVAEWLRGDLRPWAENLLDEKRLVEEGYLRPLVVRQTWRDHLDGKGRNGHKLWAVLMFQAWLDSQK
ncbi:MAG: asparagine synthase (glutamine-hydrolyzing) [Rhodospirillales bacterium]|nr:asparagine synthase (glutamine-hydrolyzing) [Rhodospirillales bacterium]